MDLFKANQQWCTRPQDERFSNLQEMYDVCRGYYAQRATANVPYEKLQAVYIDGINEVALQGESRNPALFSNWAFEQLTTRIGVPTNFARELPAKLTADLINYKLSQKNSELTQANILLHKNPDNLLIRSITSNRYARIWNWEILERVMRLENGWRVPPARPAFQGQKGARPATAEDVLTAGERGLSVNIGDMIAPAGLYASDHDMFVFMVNESRRISDGTDQGLARGFFVSNSEVGAATFRLTRFLYRFVCGNHIVWDAKKVIDVNIRHIGNAVDTAWKEMTATVTSYADESASDVEAKIAHAKTYQIAKTKDEVLDALFGMKLLPRKVLTSAYELAEKNSDVDGSPFTPWGIAQGLTRLSQTLPFADERVKVDSAATKVLEIAF